MKPLLLSIALMVGLFVPGPVHAQDATDDSRVTFTELVLDDGSRLIGVILSESAEAVLFRTASGAEITLDPASIRRRRTVEGRMVRGSFEPFDPSLTRTLFAPTARSLPKETGYVVLHEVLFLSGAWGFGGGVTLSGGLSLIPGAPEQLIWFAPKVTVLERDQVSVAGGLLAGTLTGSADAGGILYGVTSFGSRVRTGTIGVGFLFGEGEVDDTPIVLFSGQWALGDRLSLISENYAVPSESSGALISLGVRIRGSRMTMDLAGITHSSIFGRGDGMAVIPWLGVTRNF